jgi:hypothetical protein
MADVKIPYLEAGLAAFEKLDSFTQGFLLSGSDPKLEPGFPMEVAAGQALQQFQVLGLNGTGKLVPATYAADASGVEAQFVCTQAVAAPAGAGVTVPVFFAGCFNPDALVWDATYDTDAKKANAFMGAPSPTRIMIRKRG